MTGKDFADWLLSDDPLLPKHVKPGPWITLEMIEAELKAFDEEFGTNLSGKKP